VCVFNQHVVDVSYINLSSRFYYLCSVLDGCIVFLLHWDLRESMKEADIEMILKRSQVEVPGSEAEDHLRQRTAVHRPGLDVLAYLAVLPAANGKIERWHKSLKREFIRPLTPLTLGDARRLIQIYVHHYNTV
jgi:putative transposase